jgi:class 3 adenylate cyclase/predicted ATPase
MTFYEVLEQVLTLLQHHGRASYRALKRQFNLDDGYIEDLKVEIIEVQRLARDQDGTMLVWVGNPAMTLVPLLDQSQLLSSSSSQSEASRLPQTTLTTTPVSLPQGVGAEFRQLTVMFCDLVDSTALSTRLDPEALREVILVYQHTCTEIIQRFEGHIAQYLGDGLLVYFGYPQAHEDNARRAVRSGLEVVEAVRALQTRLLQERGIRLAVRVGIHTGVVVVGEVGEGTRQERLALGETPNIAARIQGLAVPDTVVISGATQRLVQRYFVCQDLGQHALRGVAVPVQVYRVLQESTAQSSLDMAPMRGVMPLVGREQEVGLLLERWERVKEGLGQVVLLSGEAGIGKSRLVEVIKVSLAGEPATLIEGRCSPYTEHSALYPVIVYLQRLVGWSREDPPQERLRKLEETLARCAMPLLEVVPLFAGLLSLSLPERYPPLTLTPSRQKQRTLEALLAWLLQETERQPVLLILEDLQWSDPSTLEFLSLLVEQAPTARLYVLCTFRPSFRPPWALHAYLTHLTLARLSRHHTELMILQVTEGKAFPPEVQAQLVTKTDGVPLFVEELTKMVLESGLLRAVADRYELTEPLPPLAIPATLHDSLMARLDRLAAPAKMVAQLGATISRQFSYELLRAVAPLDETTLQHALSLLVEAELIHQRGLLPRATYLFKHALIQETAYQSLLKSTRQQQHQQIAQVLLAQFPETADLQPELLAHHYTEAGLADQAVTYWLRAGQRAVQRSANIEAIQHFTQGLELLQHLPATPERTQHELALQLALRVPLRMLKGHTAPEVAQVQRQAYMLCQEVGDSPQRFSALVGLWGLSLDQAQYHMARELGEQCFALAQRLQDPMFLQEAHLVLGATLVYVGELVIAHSHIEQAMALYDPQKSHSLELGRSVDSGVMSLSYASRMLWLLGYPGQACAKSRAACVLAQELSHAYSLGFAWQFAITLHLYRRESQRVREYAETAIAFADEHGFVRWLAGGMIGRGWALAEQGLIEDGLTQLCQGVAIWRSMGGELGLPHFLAQLAEMYGKSGQATAGLQVITEALTLVQKNAEHFYAAELYRLKGELLLLAQAGDEHGARGHRITEAEACFQQALDVARNQHAKSLELRASLSLSRLWRTQGRQEEARYLLAGIYSWFTEGFDTPDLQEAQALLEA